MGPILGEGGQSTPEVVNTTDLSIASLTGTHSVSRKRQFMLEIV